jgi:hypothetical protein
VLLGIKALKTNKATGNSFVNAELLKYFARIPAFVECITTLFNCVSMKGIPISWNNICITSLFKKGDA